MEYQNKNKKIYAREFHEIRDNDTALVFDIENVRLIQVNDLELGVLNQIKEKPLPVPELKKRFVPGKAGNVEEAIIELSSLDMLGYSPFKKISPEEIEDYNRGHWEYLKQKDLRQISLNVTHKCNLNCDYCYGEDGSYGGPAVHMSRDTAKQAIDFLLRQSADSDSVRVTIFGGEPLLNYDLVKYIIGYAKKQALKHNKKVYFGMTTNGVLLDEDKIDFLIKEKVDMTFSFDGPQEVQDKNRPFKSQKKKSSYDLIYPKILKFIEKAEKEKSFYCFRATLTRPGIVNIYDVVDFFNGFNTERIHYDFAEYANISSGDLVITGDAIKSFRQKVREVAADFKENRSTRYDSLFSGPLRAIQGKMKKKCACISPGVTYAGVSAQGDLFPCHRFVGCKETKFGDVWNGFDREKWLKKYAKVNIFSSKVCSGCWLRYFCGGMCPATNYFLGGDMVVSEEIEQEPVHCKLSKMIYEEAMLLYTGLADNLAENLAENHSAAKNQEKKNTARKRKNKEAIFS